MSLSPHLYPCKGGKSLPLLEVEGPFDGTKVCPTVSDGGRTWGWGGGPVPSYPASLPCPEEYVPRRRSRLDVSERIRPSPTDSAAFSRAQDGRYHSIS